MPDLLDYSVTRLSNATLSVPRWSVEGRIVDSQTQQTVIEDFTGANAVVFPSVLGNLSAAGQDRWVHQVVQDLIFKRFGILEE